MKCRENKIDRESSNVKIIKKSDKYKRWNKKMHHNVNVKSFTNIMDRWNFKQKGIQFCELYVF